MFTKFLKYITQHQRDGSLFKGAFAKAEDMNSNPGSHMVDGKNSLI